MEGLLGGVGRAVPRQELLDAVDRMIGDAGQHGPQKRFGIEIVEFGGGRWQARSLQGLASMTALADIIMLEASRPAARHPSCEFLSGKHVELGANMGPKHGPSMPRTVCTMMFAVLGGRSSGGKGNQLNRAFGRGGGDRTRDRHKFAHTPVMERQGAPHISLKTNGRGERI